MLTGQEIVTFFPLRKKILITFFKNNLYTAAFAIINLVLFLIPSKPVYFEAVSQVVGKMYSNTMMVVLNSRMVYGITNDTASTTNEELSVLTFTKRSLFFNEQASVPVAHNEQRSDQLQLPLEDNFKRVSVHYTTVLDIDIESSSSWRVELGTAYKTT